MFRPLVLALAALSTALTAQAQLRAGPMLGYNTMREVAVWVQTERTAEVQLRYHPADSADYVLHSATANTAEPTAYCATLVADSLDAGTAYVYEVLVDGRPVATDAPLTFVTQPNWAYRTEPPEFSFAFGSCYYANEPAYDRPGDGYGGEYRIFSALDSFAPDLMIWAGDNIYLRPGDFQAASGFRHRYSHSRAVPELQALLRSVHHYATWDDHDYGPNDADRSYLHKGWAREAFDLFWANPPADHPMLAPGIGTAFRYVDAEFFLLDDRTFRTPNDCKTCDPKVYFGEGQLEWLIEALAGSTASFKFVVNGGQVLNPAKAWETLNNLAPAEREEILTRITAEGVENVIFLTGDRHHTELSRYERGGVVVHDFTSSPLTAGVAVENEDEGNTLRVDGTYVAARNFGHVTLSGPRDARVATLRDYDAEGNLLWERVIEQAGGE